MSRFVSFRFVSFRFLPLFSMWVAGDVTAFIPPFFFFKVERGLLGVIGCVLAFVIHLIDKTCMGDRGAITTCSIQYHGGPFQKGETSGPGALN